MKLAFCLFKYFPFGGMQRDFLAIAKECLRRGHTVDVYTMRWEGDQPAGITLHILTSKGWQNHTRTQHFVAQLQPILSEKAYDAVVGFNKMPGLDVYYAADTCYQAKARFQHGIGYRILPRYRHWVAYEEAVFAAEAKTTILLLAKTQQAEFMHYYQTAPIRFHLLPPGIARDRIAPPNAADIRLALREKWHLNQDTLLLLMVGSGFKTKGLDRILLGIAALPLELRQRARLFIIGKDNPSQFQRQAKKLGITENIQFLGGRDDVPQFMLAADIFLHPAYNENTGTVLLEAIIAGLPVLTTDVCGYADYVLEANAGNVLSSPFQQEEFNQVLQDMLVSSLKNTWQQNGLTFARTADIYRACDCAVDIIESKR